MPKYNMAKDVDPRLFPQNQGNNIIPQGYHMPADYGGQYGMESVLSVGNQSYRQALLEKRFIRISGIYFLYRLISVGDTINKK
jgi:hypothetical protein